MLGTHSKGRFPVHGIKLSLALVGFIHLICIQQTIEYNH